MAQSDISSSSRLATPVGGTVQKPHVLIVPEDSEKAKASYILNYPGEIKVVTRKEYENYIKEMASVDSHPDEPDLVTTLHPPTNLYWDPTNPLDVSYSNNGATPTVEITITFDPSFDENSTDSKNITYHAEVALSNPSTIQNNNNAGVGEKTTTDENGNTSTIKPGINAPVTIIQNTIKNSSLIELRWMHVKGASSYEIVAYGKNLSKSSGKSKFTYTKIADGKTANGGFYYYGIVPESGKSLTGNYYFVINAKYNKSTATGKRFPSSGYISI
jgi:hypothetical protein